MKFLRRLAIALYRLLFSSPVRPKSRTRRLRTYESSFKSHDAYSHDAYEQGELDLQSELNSQIVALGNSLKAYPDSFKTTYYPSLYSQGYHPQMLSWQSVEDEYDEGYEYEEEYAEGYEEDALDDSYGTVEYRFETFGGDTFIEYSYEGDLDEQEIVRVLNWLWTSSADRFNLDRFNVLIGTLRMPPSQVISLSHLR